MLTIIRPQASAMVLKGLVYKSEKKGDGFNTEAISYN